MIEILAMFAPLAIPVGALLYGVLRVTRKRIPMSATEIVTTAALAILLIAILKWTFGAFRPLNLLGLIVVVGAPLMMALRAANAMLRRQRSNGVIALFTMVVGCFAMILLSVSELYLACFVGGDCL